MLKFDRVIFRSKWQFPDLFSFRAHFANSFAPFENRLAPHPIAIAERNLMKLKTRLSELRPMFVRLRARHFQLQIQSPVNLHRRLFFGLSLIGSFNVSLFTSISTSTTSFPTFAPSLTKTLLITPSAGDFTTKRFSGVSDVFFD